MDPRELVRCELCERTVERRGAKAWPCPAHGIHWQCWSCRYASEAMKFKLDSCLRIHPVQENGSRARLRGKLRVYVDKVQVQHRRGGNDRGPFQYDQPRLQKRLRRMDPLDLHQLLEGDEQETLDTEGR